MGQFNYADSPSLVNDVIFWSQKQREMFETVVVVAGPFSIDQMMEFEAHSIQAFSNHNDGELNGFFTPTENLMSTLVHFKN